MRIFTCHRDLKLQLSIVRSRRRRMPFDSLQDQLRWLPKNAFRWNKWWPKASHLKSRD